jgi:mRNA-degrading endonuclease RelE of RelBE toxin-antitoxin system
VPRHTISVVVKKSTYRIDYSPEAVDHLAGLTARQSATVLDVVVRLLSHDPATPTRNRKVLRANSVAPWELRIGVLRVYYDFGDEPERVVVVKAVGIKHRNRVRIGGEEVEL